MDRTGTGCRRLRGWPVQPHSDVPTSRSSTPAPSRKTAGRKAPAGKAARKTAVAG